MQIDPSDREEFLEKFHGLLAASSELSGVTHEIMKKKDDVAGAFARLSELSDVTSNDAIQAWSSAKSSAVADGLDEMAEMYERMSVAMRKQAQAIRETGATAETIIEKAKAQESAS